MTAMTADLVRVRNSREEVAQRLAPKEWTVQEIDNCIRELFKAFPFKKISFHTDSREVLLNFDFPDAVDREAFGAQAQLFAEKTGWTIEVSPSMNFASAALLLGTLFGKGKYLELAFISPMAGRIYADVLATLATQIQWRIRIADSVNQIEAFRMISVVCDKYAVRLFQNPSYLPAEKSIRIRVPVGTDAEVPEKIGEEFLVVTGLNCKFS